MMRTSEKHFCIDIIDKTGTVSHICRARALALIRVGW